MAAFVNTDIFNVILHKIHANYIIPGLDMICNIKSFNS
jgi:hypothetical protein